MPPEILAEQQKGLEKIAQQLRRERLDKEAEDAITFGFCPRAELWNGRWVQHGSRSAGSSDRGTFLPDSSVTREMLQDWKHVLSCAFDNAFALQQYIRHAERVFFCCAKTGARLFHLIRGVSLLPRVPRDWMVRHMSAQTHARK